MVNLIAVFGAGLASFILGGLWYSPMLFGNMWMQLSGINPSKMKTVKKSDMQKSYVAAFVTSLITAYILAILLQLTSAITLPDALEIGFLAWLGFLATTTLNSVLWEGKPVKLYILNNAHLLVSMLLMSGILAIWG